VTVTSCMASQAVVPKVRAHSAASTSFGSLQASLRRPHRDRLAGVRAAGAGDTVEPVVEMNAALWAVAVGSTCAAGLLVFCLGRLVGASPGWAVAGQAGLYCHRVEAGDECVDPRMLTVQHAPLRPLAGRPGKFCRSSLQIGERSQPRRSYNQIANSSRIAQRRGLRVHG
jgi:hypothetical protein